MKPKTESCLKLHLSTVLLMESSATTLTVLPLFRLRQNFIIGVLALLYVFLREAYIEALSGWLSKFIAPEVELCSKNRSSSPVLGVNGPPLLATCHEWLASLEKLPNEAVVCALKNFGKDIRALWVQQGEEQKQKIKVEGLAKELERKVLAFQRIESRILGSKLSEQEIEVNVRIEYLAERKNLLDMFRKRIDAEKVKHHASMEESR